MSAVARATHWNSSSVITVGSVTYCSIAASAAGQASQRLCGEKGIARLGGQDVRQVGEVIGFEAFRGLEHEPALAVEEVVKELRLADSATAPDDEELRLPGRPAALEGIEVRLHGCRRA